MPARFVVWLHARDRNKWKAVKMSLFTRTESERALKEGRISNYRPELSGIWIVKLCIILGWPSAALGGGGGNCISKDNQCVWDLSWSFANGRTEAASRVLGSL